MITSVFTLSLPKYRLLAEGRTKKMKVVIADEDADVVAHLTTIVEELGHRADGYTNGEALLHSLTREAIDLVIVDWNIPSKSEPAILKWMETKQHDRPPVIMLTNRAAKKDISEALNAGADDYITKPEDRSVIAARVSAFLRKTSGAGAFDTEVTYGIYLLNRLDHSVTMHDNTVFLTAKEFELAELFFKHADRTLSRNYIMKAIWRTTASLATRTLDMHISRIRSKLKLQPENGFRISTVFGYGYRMESSAR